MLLSRKMLTQAGLFLWALCCLTSSVEGIISCSPNPCKNNGVCLSNPGAESYCECPDQFVGEYCQHLNPCRNGPGPRCQNGGTCNVILDVSGPRFNCECPVGYKASLCEIAVENACDSDPCMNGATCQLLTLDTYVCQCPSGYRGDQCELVDHCASKPCRNGATCHSPGNTYVCTCPQGFTGLTCTTDVNECRDRPCRHGTCTNTFGSYTCNCEVGYTGVNCESHYVPCEPSPCQNGGTCIPQDLLNYKCQCPKGFKGKNCEQNIDDCHNHLCQNGEIGRAHV